MKIKFLFFLTLLFWPIAPLRAQVCACYDEYNNCEEIEAEDETDCDDGCESQLRESFSYSEFSDVYGEELDVSYNCQAAEALTKADAAPNVPTGTTTATTTTTETEYVLPALSVNIPTISFSKIMEDNGYIEVNWLGEYVTGMYKFLLTISGIFAVLMFMVGGLQYVAAPSGSGAAEAKKRITNALTGMVLLFCVFLILYTVNPKLTVFEGLRILKIKEVPLESLEVTFESGDSCESENLFGKSVWQDCMLNTFGKTESEVKSQLVDVAYKSKTYKVHKLVAADFTTAFNTITAANINYDPTRSSAGGTFNWRCNKNSTGFLSPHAFGIAIDFNPDTNPNCPLTCQTGGTCSCIGGDTCGTICASGKYDLPSEIITAFSNNSFTWGGGWSSVKDYMHFHSKKYCSN